MRIISKNKDYYDTAMAHGQDQSVVFVRNSVTLDIELIPKSIVAIVCGRRRSGYDIHPNHKNNVTLSYVLSVVVFCGRIYRCIAIKRTVGYPDDKIEIKVVYSYDEYIAFHEFYGIIPVEQRWSSWRESIMLGKNESAIKNWFIDQQSHEVTNFCIENKYSVLVYTSPKFLDCVSIVDSDKKELVANGILDKLQFYRVVDSFTAYQELDMFISGTLAHNVHAEEPLEDKYRIAAHGFDKFSFRKSKPVK